MLLLKNFYIIAITFLTAVLNTAIIRKLLLIATLAFNMKYQL